MTDAYLEMAASTADDEDTFVTFHRNDLVLPRLSTPTRLGGPTSSPREIERL